MIRPASMKKNKVLSTSYQKRNNSFNQQPIKPNQIVITDFTFGSNNFEKKKKRCPLWMLTKKMNKKQLEQGNVFTNQGIMQEVKERKDNQEPASGSQPKGKQKCRSSKVLRKSTLVPFNFVKAKVPRQVNTTDNEMNNFPIFHYYPKSRCLYSALSDRRPEEDRPLMHKRVISSKAPPSVKKEIKKETGELGAWNTIQVQYDDFI